MFQKIKEIFIEPDVDEKFRIPLKTKLRFSVGSFGYALSSGIFAAWLLNFYIKIVKIDPLFYALAWGLYFAWNSINDPLIGYLEDRTNTKNGRRIPWLRVATPLISVAFIFLFFPPMSLDPTLISSQWTYFLWLFAFLMIYDLFYTIIGISENALVAELTIEPVERANTNFFWSIGLGLGQAITFIVPFLFIVNEPGVAYETNLPIIQFLVIIFAIIGSLALAVFSFGIKERPEFLYSEKNKMGLVESIKYTLKNKGFLIYASLFFTITFFFTITYSQLSFFVQDVLQISGSGLLSSTPLLFFVGASLIGFPIGLVLNEKLGGKRALICLLSTVIVGEIMLTFSFNIIGANISLLVMGLGYSGINLIFPTLLADVIDKDELNTGYRREGAYFGSAAFFTKPAQSLAALVTGIVFTLTGYQQYSTQQTALVQFGIKLTIGLIPAIVLFIGILFLRKFPIDASTQEYKKMKKKIEKIHDQKLKELKESLKEKNQ